MTTVKSAFSHLGLDKSVLSALSDLGYERATPIQEKSIPILLDGGDLLAQAKTGTGKTAAFALPILSRLSSSVREPQALVLAPTRELAIQVAEAFKSYAKYIKNFSVVAIYGGQDFGIQLRSLKRGPQIVVGTPGRLMDHLRRNTLSLSHIKMVVLDEADEMLKIGFADDVEWILSQIKTPHQTALFSATIPAGIQKISQKYLKNAERVQIQSQTNTAETIEQFYIPVTREQKLSVLTRFLETEKIQAAVIFTRTKNESSLVAEKLQARGYAAAALNGDMNQTAREKTIGRLRTGSLDLLVATDVAARGIDLNNITHVINYDIPLDVDSYVHRIGRTGRAGRSGRAILFVTPREQRLFRDIEHHIKKTIPRIDLPSVEMMRENRLLQLSEKIIKIRSENSAQLTKCIESVGRLASLCQCSPKEVAAALMLEIEGEHASHDEVIEIKEDKQKHFHKKSSRQHFRKRQNSKSHQGKSRPKNR